MFVIALACSTFLNTFIAAFINRGKDFKVISNMSKLKCVGFVFYSIKFDVLIAIFESWRPLKLNILIICAVYIKTQKTLSSPKVSLKTIFAKKI
jgi:hypothetical protein